MKLLDQDDPMLRRECRADAVVTSQQIHEMFAIMRAHDAMGLAAPQVGIDARLFITHWGEIFFNQTIIEESKALKLGQEGCLSLPGVFWMLGRPKWVRMSSGQIYSDMNARVICHEMDHLDGVLMAGNVE